MPKPNRPTRPLDEPVDLFPNCDVLLTATRGQIYAANMALGHGDFYAGLAAFKKPVCTAKGRALTDSELLAVLEGGPAALEVAA